MIVNLNCELDWIWNQISHIPLGGSMRIFPGRIAEVGGLGWVPRVSCTFWQARYEEV